MQAWYPWGDHTNSSRTRTGGDRKVERTSFSMSSFPSRSFTVYKGFTLNLCKPAFFRLSVGEQNLENFLMKNAGSRHGVVVLCSVTAARMMKSNRIQGISTSYIRFALESLAMRSREFTSGVSQTNASSGSLPPASLAARVFHSCRFSSILDANALTESSRTFLVRSRNPSICLLPCRKCCL